MHHLLDLFLRSIMAVVMAIAAVVGAIVTFPFIAVYWLYKQICALFK